MESILRGFLEVRWGLFFLVWPFQAFPSYLSSVSRFLSSWVPFAAATVLVNFWCDLLCTFFLQFCSSTSPFHTPGPSWFSPHFIACRSTWSCRHCAFLTFYALFSSGLLSSFTLSPPVSSSNHACKPPSVSHYFHGLAFALIPSFIQLFSSLELRVSAVTQFIFFFIRLPFAFYSILIFFFPPVKYSTQWPPSSFHYEAGP